MSAPKLKASYTIIGDLDDIVLNRIQEMGPGWKIVSTTAEVGLRDKLHISVYSQGKGKLHVVGYDVGMVERWQAEVPIKRENTVHVFNVSSLYYVDIVYVNGHSYQKQFGILAQFPADLREKAVVV